MSSTSFPPRFLHRFNRSAVCHAGISPASGLPSAIGPAQGRGFCRLWQFRNVEQQDEAEFGDKGPLYRDRKLAQVEAVLFLVRAPLTSRKIAQLARLADGTEARKLVRRLKLLLREGQSAFQVEEVAGGYQLLTCAEVSPWLGRFFEAPARPRLSAPAMETLAVVAYRQPILRAEIEAIRGVQCDDILRQLLDRDLIRIIGRSEDLGRPLLYGTTRRFLELFGLRNLEELPRAVKRSAASDPEQITAPDPNTSSNEVKPGASQAIDKITTDSISEEKSVTTRVRYATEQEQELAKGMARVAKAPLLRPATKPLSGAKEEDEDEEEDEEWEDDDDDEDDDEDDAEEEDDFVDDDWEEVDDEEEDDDEEDDEEEDEDWEEDDDDDWEDDDEEDDDEEEEWEEEDSEP